MSDCTAGCGPRFSGGNDNCGWIVILILLYPFVVDQIYLEEKTAEFGWIR